MHQPLPTVGLKKHQGSNLRLQGNNTAYESMTMTTSATEDPPCREADLLRFKVLTLACWRSQEIGIPAQCQIEAHELHPGKGLDVHLSLAVVLSTIQVTVRFGSVPPQFFSAAGHWSSTSLPIPPT
ncbi:hypothetical protein TNCV_3376581 [Trichonephila clavipes]|nr:hypothetical protein TNCV_3376581 [Trichonephila clavipes]